MANMSYCRFRNTLNDLHDCYEHMEDRLHEDDDEKPARKKLIRLCQKIAADYGDEIENA